MLVNVGTEGLEYFAHTVAINQIDIEVFFVSFHAGCIAGNVLLLFEDNCGVEFIDGFLNR